MHRGLSLGFGGGGGVLRHLAIHVLKDPTNTCCPLVTSKSLIVCSMGRMNTKIVHSSKQLLLANTKNCSTCI